MKGRPYTIRLEDDLIEAIDGEAARAGMSRSDWMRHALEEATQHMPPTPGWVPVSVDMLKLIRRRGEQIAAAAKAQLEGSSSNTGDVKERSGGGEGTGGTAGAGGATIHHQTPAQSA